MHIYVAPTVVFTFHCNKPYEIKQNMNHRSFLIIELPRKFDVIYRKSHKNITQFINGAKEDATILCES